MKNYYLQIISIVVMLIATLTENLNVIVAMGFLLIFYRIGELIDGNSKSD